MGQPFGIIGCRGVASNSVSCACSCVASQYTQPGAKQCAKQCGMSVCPFRSCKYPTPRASEVNSMIARPHPPQRAVSLASSIKGHASSSREITCKSAQHNLSRVSSQWDLSSSSDMIPSEGDSVYAASMARSSIRTDTCSDKENTPKSKDRRQVDNSSEDPQKQQVPAPHLVRFVNRPEGTPLFTISEQRSLATLRSRASNLTFRIRAIQDGLQTRKTASEDFIRSGPKSASADDITFLAIVQEAGKSSNVSESLIDSDTKDCPLRPFQPPFSPPHRCETPEGVDRWPADIARDGQPRPSSSHALREASLAALHGRATPLRRTLSGYIRRGLGITQTRTTRPWRPPVSGHSAVDMHNHPFQNVTAAETQNLVPRDQEPTLEDVPPIPPAASESLERRSRQYTSSVSSAQRALGSISGNSIPVNPARVLSSCGPRTAAVPDAFATQTSHSISTAIPAHVEGEAYVSDTLRTVEIIGKFPHPPRAPLSLFAPSPKALRNSAVQFLGHDEAVEGQPLSQDVNNVSGEQSRSRAEHARLQVARMNDSAVYLANQNRKVHGT